MKLINETLLQSFRDKMRCEHCRKSGPTDPHHIFSKGAGRVDLACNLVALCRTCHTGFHTSGKPSRAELLVIVEARDKITPGAVEEAVHRVRRDQSHKEMVIG